MALELLIRPFQLTDITPPTAVIGGTVLADPVVITIETEGGKTFDWSYSFSGETGTAANTFKEVKRKNEKKRIENPDDPSQFVEVQRAKEIKFTNASDPSITQTHKYSYPDSSPTPVG
ncbi:MAG TPA: hypothetical protein VH678_15005 [Xanthobacteraceae bacterium]|jgi:hypothetical protein